MTLTQARTPPAFEPHPVEILPGALASGLLILCDHASNAVPQEFGDLGLPETEFRRHIAYDIGAADVTRALARRLGAPAILTRFSRLVIDPNRGRDDPTLVMRLSDGAVVPGNARLGAADIQARIERFYDPYDSAVDGRHRRGPRGRLPAGHRHDPQLHADLARLAAALACGHPVGCGRALRPTAPRGPRRGSRPRGRRQRAL